MGCIHGTLRWGPLALAWALALAGCGGEDSADRDSSYQAGGGDGNGFNGIPSGDGDTTSGSGGSMGAIDDRTPPEVEEAIEFEPPQASERFVFAANPVAGTVAVINAETLHIQTLETGEQPTYLRTLAGTDDAIVLNVGSDDATVIRMKGDTATLSNLPVTAGANTISVAPDGKHAVVLFAADRAKDTVGFMDFQTVTLLKLEDGADQSTNVTVGYKPRSVFFRDDSTRAYVVTDDGVSTLDLGDIDENGPRIADNKVFAGGDPEDENTDVSITPDGHYALSRLVGDSLLRLLDLESGQTHMLDLAAAFMDSTDADAGMPAGPPVVEVTDLDLAPDGSYAVAVLRSHSAVMRVAIPGGFSDPAEIDTHTLDDELIGLVEPVPDSSLVLAYTTASDSVERLTVLDLATGDARAYDVHKAIKAVSMAPDGSTAVIVHKKLEGDPLAAGLSHEERTDRSHAYSVLHPQTGFSRLTTTSVAPGAFVVVVEADSLFLLLRSDATGVREVHRVDLTTFTSPTPPIVLDSPPIAVGAVATQQRVFVSQDHPEGRMTFIDWGTSESITVTGYELNAKVRD